MGAPETAMCVLCVPLSPRHSTGSDWTKMCSRRAGQSAFGHHVLFWFFVHQAHTLENKNKQLTGYLAHTLIVLAAVSGFLTVGITVAHRFPPGVIKTLVVAAGAAVWTLPLSAARLSLRNYSTAEKRQISTNNKPKARWAPSTRTHDGNFIFFPLPQVHLLHGPLLLAYACVTTDAA